MIEGCWHAMFHMLDDAFQLHLTLQTTQKQSLLWMGRATRGIVSSNQHLIYLMVPHNVCGFISL